MSEGHIMSSSAVLYTSVTVPAITDPDIGSVDVVIDAALPAGSPGITVGDAIVAIPLEALETNCRMLSAYVIGVDTIRCVFGSLGGDVTGSAKSFAFHVLYPERSGW